MFRLQPCEDSRSPPTENSRTSAIWWKCSWKATRNLWVSERKTGYDWHAHIDEFEAEIAATKDDLEFAQAMLRILLRLNNGHTSLLSPSSASTYSGFLVGLYMGRWKAEVKKTTKDRVQYWWELVNTEARSAEFSGAAFGSVYSAGKYHVVSLSSEAEDRGIDVQPGWEVVQVDGVPVNEYVSRFLGEQSLWYDPVRDCLYLRWLQFPPVSTALTSTAPTSGASVKVVFRTGEGAEISLDIPTDWTLKVPRYTGRQGTRTPQAWNHRAYVHGHS